MINYICLIISLGMITASKQQRVALSTAHKDLQEFLMKWVSQLDIIVFGNLGKRAKSLL